MQQFLDDHGLSQFRVVTGKTSGHGYSVEQLKERTDLENKIAILESALEQERERVRELALENKDIKQELEKMMRTNEELLQAQEQKRSQTWGSDAGWGKERDIEWTKSI